MEKKFIDKHINSAKLITSGINISKEIACGKIVFNSEMAKKLTTEGENVILVKEHLFPEDIEGVKNSQGIIITHRDTGIFSLLMANTLKKSCILSNNIVIDRENNQMIVDDQVYQEGTTVSLDGKTGNIYLGSIPQVHLMGYNDMTRQNLKKKSEKIYSRNMQG